MAIAVIAMAIGVAKLWQQFTSPQTVPNIFQSNKNNLLTTATQPFLRLPQLCWHPPYTKGVESIVGVAIVSSPPVLQP
jgi:hypothetical protein